MRTLMYGRLTLAAHLAAVLLWAAGAADDPYSESALLRSPALGPHIRLSAAQAAAAPSFRSGAPFVGTYYFFWYNHATGEHFRNPDGSDALVDHPPDPTGVSYLDPAWHRKELLDIMDAGIEMMLPVYWGAPASKVADFPWHHNGLPPLVAAAEALLAEGRVPPRIGLFYDTSSLAANGNLAQRHVDLSTADGRAWLYVTIRDYYSLIPPRLWATLDGRPLVFLYTATAKAGSDDPSVFEYVRTHFAADFGGVRPYLVAERSWPAEADNAYDWGAAFSPKAAGVATLGPGYDDHAAPGRTSPRIDREDGRLYSRRWEQLLALDPALRPAIALVETWNELHEGTDICETQEYGRRYIDLTRHYAAQWKAGARLHSASPYAEAPGVETTLGVSGRDQGLRLVRNGDGEFRAAVAAGSTCVETVANGANGEQFLYFDVDDGFGFEPSGPLTVEVEFLDDGDGAVGMQYDSADRRALLAGAYKTATPVVRGHTGTWRSATFRLSDPRFCNRQNSFTDFRLSAGGSRLTVRRVVARRD
jgi:hypothetical protein